MFSFPPSAQLIAFFVNNGKKERKTNLGKTNKE